MEHDVAGANKLNDASGVVAIECSIRNIDILWEQAKKGALESHQCNSSHYGEILVSFDGNQLEVSFKVTARAARAFSEVNFADARFCERVGQTLGCDVEIRRLSEAQGFVIARGSVSRNEQSLQVARLPGDDSNCRYFIYYSSGNEIRSQREFQESLNEAENLFTLYLRYAGGRIKDLPPTKLSRKSKRKRIKEAETALDMVAGFPEAVSELKRFYSFFDPDCDELTLNNSQFVILRTSKGGNPVELVDGFSMDVHAGIFTCDIKDLVGPVGIGKLQEKVTQFLEKLSAEGVNCHNINIVVHILHRGLEFQVHGFDDFRGLEKDYNSFLVSGLIDWLQICNPDVKVLLVLSSDSVEKLPSGVRAIAAAEINASVTKEGVIDFFEKIAAELIEKKGEEFSVTIDSLDAVADKILEVSEHQPHIIRWLVCRSLQIALKARKHEGTEVLIARGQVERALSEFSVRIKQIKERETEE